MQRLDHQGASSGLIHHDMKAIRIHTITNDSRSTGANRLKKRCSICMLTVGCKMRMHLNCCGSVTLSNKNIGIYREQGELYVGYMMTDAEFMDS